MDKLLTIETKRYSEFFRRLLIEYGDASEVKVDGRMRSVSELLTVWCKNSVICQTRDFVLRQGGVGLCGFHDHPSQTWMLFSELTFAERLQADQIIRVRVSKSAG